MASPAHHKYSHHLIIFLHSSNPSSASCSNHAVKRFAAQHANSHNGQVRLCIAKQLRTTDRENHLIYLHSSLPACNPANWASSVFVAPRDATADINAVAAKFGAAGTVVGINAVTPTNS